MTTIQEAREATDKQARAEAEIAHRYPSTKLTSLPGGQSEWTSPEMLDDATHVTLLGKPHVHVALTVNVDGVAVHHPTYVELAELLREFEQRDLDGYQSLVACLVQVVADRT